jgi:TorA maturation chaperone TorD
MATVDPAVEVERAQTYSFLAQACREPDAELLASLAEARSVVAATCAEAIERGTLEPDLGRLRVDYCRLFVGPFKLLAPPYGSVYLERLGRLMGDSTVDVRRRYMDEGLIVAASEVPDHVAIELEFAHVLSVRRVNAMRESDFRKANGYGEKRREFLSVHLGAWISEFTADVRRHAWTSFYRELAGAIEAFVSDDHANLTGEGVGQLAGVSSTSGTETGNQLAQLACRKSS